MNHCQSLSKVSELIARMQPQLEMSQQRAAIVFHCSPATEEPVITEFMQSLLAEHQLVVSPSLNYAINPAQANTCLGKEFSIVLLDFRAGINADVLGSVSGVVVGGGCLLIMLPDKHDWCNDDALFTQYLKTRLHDKENIFYVEDEKIIDVSTKSTAFPTTKKPDSPYLTWDQKNTVDCIVEAAKNQDNGCFVITSGRGRGKSASLGFVAAELLKMGFSCLLSAPRSSIVEPIFFHAKNQCADGVLGNNQLSYKDKSLSFIAPDALLENLPAADILLIDEAAAIPVSMLVKLLYQYSYIVFSTTTHGYEGTGRGFELKFCKLLDERRPEWKKITLTQPIRWAENDPLEKWVEELLFLNTHITTLSSDAFPLDQCDVQLLDKALLLSDEHLQTSVFSLLVMAHYRTSPADFQYLLNSDSVRVYVLRHTDNVLGVLLISQEGGFSKDLSHEIYRGNRRPKGHLLAQTLCFHGGSEEAAELVYSRVMRITIHPDIQNQGYGRFFLQQVIEREQLLGIDIIGSSFAMNQRLLAFWLSEKMQLLRVGFSIDHVSASHSAVVARALSEKANVVVNLLAQKFKRNVPFWYQGSLRKLPQALKAVITPDSCDVSMEVSDLDFQDVISFAQYNRNYEACLPALLRYLHHAADQPNTLTPLEHKLIELIKKHKENLAEITAQANLSGKTETLKMLRKVYHHLLHVNAVNISN